MRPAARPSLIACNNTLAQIPDLNDVVAGMAELLAPSGLLTIEVPHLLRLLEDNQFDTIYHEHFSYFSLATLDRIMTAHGLDGGRRRRAADARRLAPRARPPRRRRGRRPGGRRADRPRARVPVSRTSRRTRRSARGSPRSKRAVLAELLDLACRPA